MRIQISQSVGHRADAFASFQRPFLGTIGCTDPSFYRIVLSWSAPFACRSSRWTWYNRPGGLVEPLIDVLVDWDDCKSAYVHGHHRADVHARAQLSVAQHMHGHEGTNGQCTCICINTWMQFRASASGGRRCSTVLDLAHSTHTRSTATNPL